MTTPASRRERGFAVGDCSEGCSTTTNGRRERYGSPKRHYEVDRGQLAGVRAPRRPWRNLPGSLVPPVRYSPNGCSDWCTTGTHQPCHCGSGRKYKHCCLEKDDAMAATARAQTGGDVTAQRPESATAAPTRAPKHQTHQPWKAPATRGFVPRTRSPRKVGGS